MVSAPRSSYPGSEATDATPESRHAERGFRTMKRYSGGESVGRGTYWNLRYGSLVDLKEAGVLPGGEETVFYRLPFSVLFCMVLFLGAIYVILLPLIMIGMGMYVVSRRVLGGLVYQARKSVMFGWRPMEAYLAGKSERKKNGESTES